MRRLKAPVTFRELRPKAASDSEHNVLGHGPQMPGVYKRRMRVQPVK
jgi:hypothetical protein